MPRKKKAFRRPRFETPFGEAYEDSAGQLHIQNPVNMYPAWCERNAHLLRPRPIRGYYYDGPIITDQEQDNE